MAIATVKLEQIRTAVLVVPSLRPRLELAAAKSPKYQ
jgi:hypothetical protein